MTYTYLSTLALWTIFPYYNSLKLCVATDVSRNVSRWNARSALPGLAQSQSFQNSHHHGICLLNYRPTQRLRSVQNIYKKATVGHPFQIWTVCCNFAEYRSVFTSHSKQRQTCLYDGISEFDAKSNDPAVLNDFLRPSTRINRHTSCNLCKIP